MPSARVIHLGGQSTRQMPEQMFVELWRSRLYLYAKYYPQSRTVALRQMLRMAMWRDVLLASLKSRVGARASEDEAKSRRARAVLKMISDGLMMCSTA